MMDIIPYGEKAILVQFEQSIDLSTHKKVVVLTHYAESIDGVNYCIPAYCSLTISYNPEKIEFTQLKNKIAQFDFSFKAEKNKPKYFEIPVCYGGEFGPDLEELSTAKQLPSKEIIDLHTAETYHVYMMGFIPGFPYLGTLPAQLNCNRKETPRAKVPAGSIGLAGGQTGIYPTDAPGGWQIIGRTPAPIFRADKADPFMFKMGDTVKFHSIDEKEFASIQAQVDNDEITEKYFYGKS